MREHRSFPRRLFCLVILLGSLNIVEMRCIEPAEMRVPCSATPRNIEGARTSLAPARSRRLERPKASKNTERIVSLAPAMTEILFAIGAGDEVVARTTECDYPPSALAVPAIGGFDGKSISVESIIKSRPTIVCGSQGMHDWLSSTLLPLGITLYLSRAATVDDVMKEIIEAGTLTSHEAGARSTVREMQETLRAVQAKCNAPISAYWEVWASPLMAAGGTSFMSDILTHAGGKNIFSDIAAPYPTVSGESVLQRNPQVIIMSEEAFHDRESALAALRKRPGWKSIDAVKYERVILLKDTRPSPRVCGTVVQLAKEMSRDTMEGKQGGNK